MLVVVVGVGGCCWCWWLLLVLAVVYVSDVAEVVNTKGETNHRHKTSANRYITKHLAATLEKH